MAEEEGEEGDVVGIEIVADETRVRTPRKKTGRPVKSDEKVQDGFISKPTRTLLVQLSEMGMLYRRVTEFTQERQSGTAKGGMTEQVRSTSEYHYQG